MASDYARRQYLLRDNEPTSHGFQSPRFQLQLLTLRETAEILHITRERVRQIERVALRKLVKGLIKEGVTADELRQAKWYGAAIQNKQHHVWRGRFALNDREV